MNERAVACVNGLAAARKLEQGARLIYEKFSRQMSTIPRLAWILHCMSLDKTVRARTLVKYQLQIMKMFSVSRSSVDVCLGIELPEIFPVYADQIMVCETIERLMLFEEACGTFYLRLRSSTPERYARLFIEAIERSSVGDADTLKRLGEEIQTMSLTTRLRGRHRRISSYGNQEWVPGEALEE